VSSNDTRRPEFIGPTVLRLDLPRGRAQPSWWRWILGTAVAIGGSLLICFVLVKLASTVDLGIAGYQHFEFSDYSRLTIIGVLAACVGWPVVTLLTTSARRIYLWAAIIVVVVSLAPDAWILHLGQPAAGIATLAAMHIGLGLVAYPAMVFIAPQRVRPGASQTV
jgi:Family of unknown function (DUF6069)